MRNANAIHLLLALCLLPATPGSGGIGNPPSAQLPSGIEPVVRSYEGKTDLALRALKTGLDAYSKSDYAQALDQLPDAAAASATQLADYVLLYRARAALGLDRDLEALENYRALNSRYPASLLHGDAVLGECQALLKLGRAADALGLLREAKLPTGPENLFYLGRAHEEAGEKDAAITAYMRLYSTYVSHPAAKQAEQRLALLFPGFGNAGRFMPALLERAENLLRAGRHRDARNLLTRLARVKAPNATASGSLTILTAEADYHLGRASQALAQLEKTRPASAELDAKVLELKALCYRRLEREEPLLRVRDEALRRQPAAPGTARILQTIAGWYDFDNRLDKARDAYRRLASGYPENENSERAAWRAALFAYLLGRHEESAREFAHILEKRPGPRTLPLTLYWLGRCYEGMGNGAAAAYFLRRCLELSGLGHYSRPASEALARLKTAGDAAPAAPAFESLRRIADSLHVPDPTIPPPSQDVAGILERSRQLASVGLFDLASSDLRRALLVYPGDSCLRYFLARVHGLKRDPSNAIMILRRLIPGHDTVSPAALPREIWEVLFPADYRSIVEKQSARNGIDPFLILGVIRQESGFEREARSPANALGLMQLRPSTARKLSARAGVARFSTARLFQAESNIAIGTFYLASLIAQFDGNRVLALAAYNAGPGRVARWRQDFGNLDTPAFIDRIPFTETRDYIKNVLANESYYRAFYGGAINRGSAQGEQ